MPVYKEGLDAVIQPTVTSVKAAISTYEMQGGTANIFVNDDGLQLIGTADALDRIEFYDEHKIGWVARPAHKALVGEGRGPFLRRGKFKKASNMNYALNISNRVEHKLQPRPRSTSEVDELQDYEKALAEVVEEDEGRTWAGGNILVGDYILIIDSDTRMPKDCFLDAVSEMEQSPQVAIIQFTSGVMNVTTSYFEQGLVVSRTSVAIEFGLLADECAGRMTWFTHLIYTAITFAVARGDACPFVGHNAILRWEALQSAAAYFDEADGYEKYWSESHVSEDFDMALRLQCAGYTLRYASYLGDGFKEGVSLTVYDELARWEKYAFGCNELLFHPFRLWPVKGPLTPTFKQFIQAKQISVTSKVTIVAYIGTYYAMASAWILTLMNYFLTGLEYGIYDKYYADSFSTFFSIVMVFTALGNVALAVHRYRLEQGTLIQNCEYRFLSGFLGQSP